MTEAIMIATIIGAVMVKVMEDGGDRIEEGATHGFFTFLSHFAH